MCVCVCVCLCVCVYICVYVCRYLCVCICIHTGSGSGVGSGSGSGIGSGTLWKVGSGSGIGSEINHSGSTTLLTCYLLARMSVEPNGVTWWPRPATNKVELPTDVILEVAACKNEGKGRCISVIATLAITLQLDSIVYSHYRSVCINTSYC